MRDIKAHTGLRGIAAIAVFFGHAQFDLLWRGAFWFSGLYSFFYWQNAAVDLFFMLSGFILNYVYLKNRRTDWRTYLTARFARICPLYYAGLVAVLAMNFVSAHLGHAPSGDFKPSILIPNFAMTQEWPAPRAVPSINFPSWSISVEVFLYLAAFPLFAFLFARRPVHRGLCFALLLASIAVDAVFSGRMTGPHPFQYSGLVRGVSGFAAGFLLCELLYGREEPLVPGGVEITFGILALLILPFNSLHFLLPIAFALLIAFTYSPASRLAVILGSPLFAFLGAISYSVYIWHFPVIKACTLLFGLRRMGDFSSNINISAARKLLYCGGTFLMLIAVSSISYYWYETPVRRLLRRPVRERLGVEPLPASAKS